MLVRLLCLVVLLLAALLGGFVWFTASLPTGVAEPGRRTDAIIVLTGGSDRIVEGLRLLAADQAKKLLISGVHPGVKQNELLALMPELPPEMAERVVLGYAAGNTVGNADEAAEWMQAEGYRSLRLVTAAYHMPRSLLEFRRAMPGVEILAHPVFPSNIRQDAWWENPGSASLLVGEYLKYLATLVSGPFRSAP